MDMLFTILKIAACLFGVVFYLCMIPFAAILLVPGGMASGSYDMSFIDSLINRYDWLLYILAILWPVWLLPSIVLSILLSLISKILGKGK